jgi:hypothetical protein
MANPASSWDVIISYHAGETGDRAAGGDGTAPDLAHLLTQAGYLVCLDVGGCDLEAAIKGSKAMVAIVSSTYGDSKLSLSTNKVRPCMHAAAVAVPMPACMRRMHAAGHHRCSGEA